MMPRYTTLKGRQWGKSAIANIAGIIIFASQILSASEATRGGQIAMGKARFTVLTPYCVRMEWGAPVDQPTLFGYNRAVRQADAKITQDSKGLTIDTGILRLTYIADGNAFNGTNLTVVFKNGTKDAEWNGASTNASNLGGPVATLDRWKGPGKVSDGLLSRDGWYLVDDSGAPVLTARGIVQRPGCLPRSLLPEGARPVAKDCDWYLFVYGTDYKAALSSLALISGKVPMPRRHTFGSWYCRWHDYTADDFRQIVQGYKEHDFPLDILVMDMGWHTQVDANSGYGHAGRLGWTGYTWNKQLIPDPEKLLKELRTDGIFVTLNDHPCDGMRSHEEHYSEFMKMLPAGTRDNPPFSAGDPTYMNAFFKTALEPRENQGVDFWWVDWQQDYIYKYVHGVPGLSHLPWLNYLYFQHSERGERRGQGFSRWGGWGDHRNPIQFSGDTGATWDMLAFEIPFTAMSGNAGCFFWAHDLGGFAGERNPEMFTRWIQFGALSSALRVHSVGELDRRPWLWGEPFEKSMRVAYHLRSQLLPYIYTSVRQCYDQTLPLVRPMYLDYPEFEDAYLNPQQYMFGDNLLAAPVTSPGTGTNYVAGQKVWFPGGTWFNVFSGEKFSGNSTVTVNVPLDEIPLFAKAGVPIPMQPYTQRMSTAPLKQLIVRCYPGVSGSSSLYEDDGQSKGYMRQEFATTSLSYQNDADSVTVKISPVKGAYAGQPAQRASRIELPRTRKCAEALCNGQKIAVEYEEKSSMNIVTIPPMPIDQGLTIKIMAAPLGHAD